MQHSQDFYNTTFLARFVDTAALGARARDLVRERGWRGGGGDEATSDAALWHVLCRFRHFTKGGLAAKTCEVGAFERAHAEVLGRSVNPRGRVQGGGGIGRMMARKARGALGNGGVVIAMW